MRVFDFMLALYSIVAGLGMSLLVRSIGQMIEARGRIRLYWVHSCLVVVAFVAQVVSWISLWRFADHPTWTVAEALLLLCVPLLLYLVAHLAVPELDDGLAHDMREYYYRNARWTSGLLLAVVVISLLGESFIAGHFELTSPRSLRIALGLALVPGALTARPAVHAGQAVALMVLVAFGVSYVSVAIG
jgi:hypothetical protein